MDSGYTLSVGRGQPVAVAAAAAASDGMALPTVFEQAAAGVGVGGLGSGVAQVCIVRNEDAARMGGCEEQTRLTLQVRDADHANKGFCLRYTGSTQNIPFTVCRIAADVRMANLHNHSFGWSCLCQHVTCGCIDVCDPLSVCERERYGGHVGARGAIDNSCQRRRQERSEEVVGPGRGCGLS